MRTKLFITFIAVMLTALISNLIFERLILDDFEDYTIGMREDRLYWMLAAVEGSYTEEGWDEKALRHAAHWGALMGFDIRVKDTEGAELVNTTASLEGLSLTMKRRIESVVRLGSYEGPYEEYPLFAAGMELGSLYVRPLELQEATAQKGAIFKRRGHEFLVTSFLIAGGGALLLSALFSMFLTKPVRRLKKAAERVAEGDLTVRVAPGPRDEIGSLIESFNQMVESLEREEKIRQHLTSNIAHELRTPLTIMKSNMEAVADGVMDCDSAMLASLQAEVQRLINLVRGIEDFTRAEASFFKHSVKENVQLVRHVRDMVAGRRRLFEEKGLALDVSGDEALVVSVDTEKLELVIANILANALRHTRQGGVYITCGAEGGADFFVEIRDTGEGISEQEQELIFKRFYRGANSEGTGLGLAIASELAELMGGRISVASEQGKGAAFKLTLPKG